MGRIGYWSLMMLQNNILNVSLTELMKKEIVLFAALPGVTLSIYAQSAAPLSASGEMYNGRPVLNGKKEYPAICSLIP